MSIVQAQKLSLGYDEIVIKDANFSFLANDFVFITGKSGSGKSTLLKSFYGALQPLHGKLNICDTSLKNIKNSELLRLRQKIGVIFQDYKLISEFNIEKNIMLPLLIKGYSKKVCKIQANKLLKHVNLVFKANKYPNQLSGGEQQRIALARALAHNPRLLLCDEPTGNLDDYSSDLIWTLLKSVHERLKTCIVVVTHKIPSNIKMNYRLFDIRNGKMNEIV